MNRVTTCALVLSLSLTVTAVQAQQFENFGRYEVHYNVLTTDQIPAPVAQAYGIKRSGNRALLNVTVLETGGAEGSTSLDGRAIHADVSANAVNLTGQYREIPMREIEEPDDAVYYVGDFPVHHLETYTFTVTISVEDGDGPFEVEFRQQFFTE